MFFFFIWRIVALLTFAVFCQTSAWIRHKYTYIPSLLNLPLLPSPSHPRGWCRVPVWVPWDIQQIPVGYLFCIRSCKFPCYSLHTSHPLLPSPVSSSSIWCTWVHGNCRDGGAWWAAIYGVAQSRTRLKRLSSSSSRVYASIAQSECSRTMGSNLLTIRVPWSKYSVALGMCVFPQSQSSIHMFPCGSSI